MNSYWYKRLLLGTAVGVGMLFSAIRATAGNDMLFKEHLKEVGDRFDCYFSVESVQVANVISNPILNMKILPPGNIKDLNAWINAVKLMKTPISIKIMVRQVSGYSFIHIVDSRLYGSDQNVFDRNMSVNYAGTPEDLITHLSDMGLPMRNRKIISTGATVWDLVTPTAIKGDDISVRSILTDAVRAEGYSRIVWSARMQNIGSKSPISVVQYHGPLPETLKAMQSGATNNPH